MSNFRLPIAEFFITTNDPLRADIFLQSVGAYLSGDGRVFDKTVDGYYIVRSFTAISFGAAKKAIEQMGLGKIVKHG